MGARPSVPRMFRRPVLKFRSLYPAKPLRVVDHERQPGRERTGSDHLDRATKRDPGQAGGIVV